MTNDNISTHEKWDSLHEELWDRRTEMTEMKIGIAILHRERDEARRMYCSMVEGNSRQYGTSSRDVAKQLNWDCYEKETT